MSNPPVSTGRLGSENRLCVVTYSTIADWAGLKRRTVQTYAARKDFDPKNLESILTWCNNRRRTQGKRLIGMPESATLDTLSGDIVACLDVQVVACPACQERYKTLNDLSVKARFRCGHVTEGKCDRCTFETGQDDA